MEAAVNLMEQITLYWSPPSCSLTAMIALAATNAPYEGVEIDLLSDRLDYRTINASGKVPALTVGNMLITETIAIVYWLARSYPHAKLLPNDAADEAQALSLMCWMSSSLHILRRQYRLPSRFTRDQAAQVAIRADAQEPYAVCLKQLDDCTGSGRLDIAKFGLGPACHALLFHHWAVKDEMPIDTLTNLSRSTDTMLTHQFVVDALMRHASPLIA